MALPFGVQWFCSPFLVERCSEMEFVQTCSCQFNITLKCVICICLCLCSKCRVEESGYSNSQCCLLAVGLVLSAALCRYVVSC
jgi:hypothetical protein